VCTLTDVSAERDANSSWAWKMVPTIKMFLAIVMGYDVCME
jgi:hypothetical protein